MHALEDFGPDALPAVDDLLWAMDQSNRNFLEAANRVFERVGPPAVAAVFRLVRAEEARGGTPPFEAALNAIVAAGPGGVPQLRAALKVGGTRSRLAATALGFMDDDNVAAVPDLIEALGSRDTELQWRAAVSLGLIGGPATAALGRLRQLQQATTDRQVREKAEEAIGQIARSR